MEKIAWHKKANVLFVTHVLLSCFLRACSKVALFKGRNVKLAVYEAVCTNEPPEAIFLLNA